MTLTPPSPQAEHVLLMAFAVAGGLLAGMAVAAPLDRLYSTQQPPGPMRSLRMRIVLLAAGGSVLWGLCALRSSELRQFGLMAIFGTALLALSATDFERHLLPNRLMYPALLLALALSAAWPHRSPSSGLVGGLTGAAVMLAVFLVFPGFGFGDVKLSGLIGLILGFPAVLYGLLAGMILGGLGAAWMLLSGRARLRTAIAYGPYLAGGAILEMLLRR